MHASVQVVIFFIHVCFLVAVNHKLLVIRLLAKLDNVALKNNLWIMITAVNVFKFCHVRTC